MNNLALVINLGSSSLKAALVDHTGAKVWRGGRALEADETLDAVLDSWLAPELKPYRSAISLVGHRVVRLDTAQAEVTSSIRASQSFGKFRRIQSKSCVAKPVPVTR